MLFLLDDLHCIPDQNFHEPDQGKEIIIAFSST